MRRVEVLALLLVSVAMIATGLVTLFGPWALIGCGAALFAASFFINAEG